MLKLLWLEDDPKTIQPMITLMGVQALVETTVVNDIDGALEAISSTKFDHVLIDIGVSFKQARTRFTDLAKFDDTEFGGVVLLQYLLSRNFSREAVSLCTNHDRKFLASNWPVTTEVRVIPKSEIFLSPDHFASRFGELNKPKNKDESVHDCEPASTSEKNEGLETESLMHDVKTYLLHALAVSADMKSSVDFAYGPKSKKKTYARVEIEGLITDKFSDLDEAIGRIDEYKSADFLDQAEEYYSKIESIKSFGINTNRAMVQRSLEGLLRITKTSDAVGANGIALVCHEISHLISIFNLTHIDSQLKAALQLMNKDEDTDKANFNSSMILEQELRNIEPEAVSKRIELVESVERNTPLINGNYRDFQSVIRNFLQNAVKYNGTIYGQRTWIEVTHERVRDEIVTSVESWGPHIPENEHKKIFDRSFRTDLANAPGDGLGLSIAKNRSEKLNGRITLESQEPPPRNPKKNVKTTFRLHLPV